MNDTEHDAVVALLTTDALCTGTIIRSDASSGIGVLLTAAHCVDGLSPEAVVLGADASRAEFNFVPTGVAIHENWTSGDYDYDVALVRFDNRGQELPTIPPLTPALDELQAGTVVRSIGYGEQSEPSDAQRGSDGAVRQYFNKSLHTVGELQLAYAVDTTTALCFGDSGGPVLTNTAGGEWIAGVHSAGLGEGCIGSYGVSIRVSRVLDFVLSDAAYQDVPVSCDSCTRRAQSFAGLCAAEYSACKDGACDDFTACALQCDDSACVSGCSLRHGEQASAVFALNACICQPASCGEVCGECGGRYGACGLKAGGEACSQCSDEACCEESQECAKDGLCATCQGDACDESPEIQAWADCVIEDCSEACGLGAGGVEPEPASVAGETLEVSPEASQSEAVRTDSGVRASSGTQAALGPAVPMNSGPTSGCGCGFVAVTRSGSSTLLGLLLLLCGAIARHRFI